MNKIIKKYFIRKLSLHEYQSIELLKKAGISVPNGGVAFNPESALNLAKSLDCCDFVVKAQVHAGGRGKGHFKEGLKSGVHLTYSPENVSLIVSKMIGNKLITKQTGDAGLPCNSVYICERLYPRREYYVAFTLDRKSNGPVLIGSSSGGINIEEAAHSSSGDILHALPIDIYKGLSLKDSMEFLRKINFNETCIPNGAEQLIKMFNMFIKYDCTLLEINPFCETNDGKVICMDCKLQIDDNSLYRHEDIRSLRDFSQEKELDVIAAKNDINYIGLDGTIGCLVNGAGLAMATMDIIKLHGGTPANFLDIGGGASYQQVITAFNIINSDAKIKAIFVNIFGGIMRCDVIAKGIIEAVNDLKMTQPLVIRLQGTNVEEAQILFLKSKLKIILIDDFDHAAKMVVKLASIFELAQEANINVKFELLLLIILYLNSLSFLNYSSLNLLDFQNNTTDLFNL